MARRRRPKPGVNILVEMVRRIRLLWRLLHDERVPIWIKLIPVAILLYVLSPVDLVPDPILGLGQMDDITAILLGLKLFFDMCPPEIVEQHRRDLTAKESASYVDADYHILEGDEE